MIDTFGDKDNINKEEADEDVSDSGHDTNVKWKVIGVSASTSSSDKDKKEFVVSTESENVLNV